MTNKKKIVKIVIPTILIVLIALGSYIGYKKIYLPSQKEYVSKVFGENEAFLESLKYKKDSYIEVLNENDEIIEKIDLNDSTEKIVLGNAEDTNSLLFNSWKINEKVDENEEFYKADKKYFEAKPIYDEKEDYILTFTADKEATLLTNDNEVVEYLKKPYKSKTKIAEYLPKVKINEDFKGDWIISGTEEIIDKKTEANNDLTLEYQTYQDKNDNNIDDFTEEFTIDFVTNLDEEIESKTVEWEETINLPKLSDNKKLFYDWFIDKDLETKFTENIKVTDNLTLYAKLKDVSEVVNESVENPIYRNDVALQVEKILTKNNKKIDETYNQEIKEIEAEREERMKYNEENNIIASEKQVQLDLYNMDHDKTFLINFLNPTGNYRYSIVVPYGQTIKILTENGELYKEYGIRQNTSILLDDNELLSNGSELEKYHSEYREINNTVFIKIQPISK